MTAPRAFTPAERADAAYRFAELDAAADRVERHIDETARAAAIPTVAAGNEIAAPEATDFPLNRTPDQGNTTLAAIDVPTAGASAPRDDAAGSGRGAVDDPYGSHKSDLGDLLSLYKWELNRAITAAASEGQFLADDEIRTSPFSYDSAGRLTQAAADQLDRPSVAGQINKAMYGTEDPEPRNAVERYAGRVAEGFGANPVLGVAAPWATAAGEIFGEGAADFNKWAGSPLPEWLARGAGNVIGGGGGFLRDWGAGLFGSGPSAVSATSLVPRVRSWLGEAAQRFKGVAPSALPRPPSPTDTITPAAADPPAGAAVDQVPSKGALGESGEETPKDVLGAPSASYDDAARTATVLEPSWKQIEYGGSDLSELAIAHRRLHNVSSGRDVGVIEYSDTDGSLKTIVEVSNLRHTEHILLRRLQERGIDPSRVTRLYSELEPCTLPIVNCQRLIKRNIPQAEITWSFEYGASPMSRKRGMDALERAIRNLDQYELGFD